MKKGSKRRSGKNNSEIGSVRRPTAAIDVAATLVILILCGLLTLPLLVYGFPNGDDLAQHYWWVREFYSAMEEGVWYPRWLGGAYEGRGSPVMFYYPPIPFFATSVFQALGAAPLTAMALSCWLALGLSGLSMYWFAKSLLSAEWSVVAAAVYVALHYHLFDLYQRAAINEFWAFVWIPLVLGAVHRGCTGSSTGVIPILALSYCLLVVTHLPSTLLLSLVLPVFALVQTRDWRRLSRIAGALGLGLCGAAIYLAPVLFETGYLGSLRSFARAGYESGFLLEHLGSAFDTMPFPSSGNYSAFILASNWIAAGMFSLVAAGWFLIWRKRRIGNPPLWHNHLLRAVMIITAISALMTTRLSQPLWSIIPRLQVIQFPVRWFVLTSFGASLFIVAGASLISSKRKTFLSDVATVVLIGAVNLAIAAVVVIRAPFDNDARSKRLVDYTDVLEYHPRWWDRQRHVALDESPVVVDTGKAEVEAIDDYGISQSYLVRAESESSMRLRTLYFPGWVARLDGRVIDVRPSEEGHLQVMVNPGEHHLTVNLEDTPVRAAGKLVSAAALVVIIAFSIKDVRFSIRKRRSNPIPEDNPRSRT